MPLGTHDMFKFTTISVEQRDAIEILSLNRPDALNAVTPAMADELIAYFSGLHERPDHPHRHLPRQWTGILRRRRTRFGRVSPHRGQGRPQRQLDMQQRYSRIIRPDAKLPAADHSPGFRVRHAGAGFSLLLASDVRFATPAARMERRLYTRRGRRL